MTHLWHDVPSGTPDELQGIIEIPSGSRVKYEIDKTTGLLKVDRIIPMSVVYPANYGFVPRTLADDGDPLDILVLTTMEFVPGVLLKLRPIGAVQMLDNGEHDDKIICVLTNDQTFEDITCLSDLPEISKLEIEEFFRVYKKLDKSKVEINERLTVQQAKEIIAQSIQNYADKFMKHNIIQKHQP